MEYIEKIKKMLCKELDEYAMKQKLTGGDLERMYQNNHFNNLCIVLNDVDVSSPAILIILFVGLGELLYWWVVTLLLNKFLKLNEKSLNILSKAASVVIIAFAVYLVAKGTIMIV